MNICTLIQHIQEPPYFKFYFDWSDYNTSLINSNYQMGIFMNPDCQMPFLNGWFSTVNTTWEIEFDDDFRFNNKNMWYIDSSGYRLYYDNIPVSKDSAYYYSPERTTACLTVRSLLAKQMDRIAIDDDANFIQLFKFVRKSSSGLATTMNVNFMTAIEASDSSGLKYIYGKYMFGQCKYLERIVLPSTMEVIYNKPFVGISPYVKIICKSEQPPITAGGNPFADSTSSTLYKNATLCIPTGCTANYKVANRYNKNDGLTYVNYFQYFLNIEEVDF